VSWKYAEDNITSGKMVNIAVVAYVTTEARLKLYDYMNRLGQSVLYCDTDSVVYVQKTAKPSKIAIGDYLGDLTDELQEYGSGSYIDEFISGGPKNYAFSVICLSTGKRTCKCKVKCITLNYDTSKVVNFNTLKTMI
jgi:hypothetical protein